MEPTGDRRQHVAYPAAYDAARRVAPTLDTTVLIERCRQAAAIMANPKTAGHEALACAAFDAFDAELDARCREDPGA